ncbi:MAG: hypothetical protein IPM91_07440 [Bacteroidetes bacterium]|nr:hypothetical protein [Bacteroidota bacterium]
MDSVTAKASNPGIPSDRSQVTTEDPSPPLVVEPHLLQQLINGQHKQ